MIPRKFTVDIYMCFECPYLEHKPPLFPHCTAKDVRLPDGTVTSEIVHDVYTIPDWCPLPRGHADIFVDEDCNIYHDGTCEPCIYRPPTKYAECSYGYRKGCPKYAQEHGEQVVIDGFIQP